jgi:hypothetical protein
MVKERTIQAVFAGCLSLTGTGAARGTTANPAPSEVPSYGYEQPWKATVGVYDTAGDVTFDLNLRRKLGDFNVWLGSYIDPKEESVARVGTDYTFQSLWLRATPGVQWATNGFFGGSIYGELGSDVFLIAGFSETNLKPSFNLTFDPNESVQLGAGAALGRDRLSAFVIFDVRLGTGQQNSHLVWRHWIDEERRLTVDVLYKSGHTDTGEFVRGTGLTVTYDFAPYFVRLAYDAYANFGDDTMWRLAGGFRF